MAKFTQDHLDFLAKFIRYELELARELVEHQRSLKDAPRVFDAEARVHTIEGMARLLASRLDGNTQPRPFDRASFLAACSVKLIL
jgi:hypothetical protein